MKKEFDFYEFTGIVLPGIIVLLFLVICVPGAKSSLLGDKLGLGEFGVLVLVSYVVGHLMQAITNLWEKMYWVIQGGMPTDWLRNPKQKLISPEQLKIVEGKIPTLLHTTLTRGIPGSSKSTWRGLTRQMYAAVQGSGRNSRVDTFNGNFGLMRGTVSAGLIIFVSTIEMGLSHERRVLIWTSVMILLAGYRMQKFALLYARELFAQFAQLSDATEGKVSGNEKS